MNISINKVIVALIVFIVLDLLAYAEEPKEDKQQKSAEPQKGYDNKKETKLPAEFIPSEKIKSDSFIAFPVDI